jgi:hypothetical protein
MVDEFQNAGDKSVRLDAKNLGAGVYYYRLMAKQGSAFINIGMRKMVLVR